MNHGFFETGIGLRHVVTKYDCGFSSRTGVLGGVLDSLMGKWLLPYEITPLEENRTVAEPTEGSRHLSGHNDTYTICLYIIYLASERRRREK